MQFRDETFYGGIYTRWSSLDLEQEIKIIVSWIDNHPDSELMKQWKGRKVVAEKILNERKMI